MTLTIQQSRAAGQFRALDFDGNGYLERADYEKTAGRILDAFGVAAEAPKGSNMVEEYVGLFERLRKRADTDGDGRVSEAEFLASVGRSVDRSGGRAMRPVAHAIFTVADADADEWITEEEFLRYVRASAMSEAGAAAVLARIGEAGRVSRTAFVDLIEGFYGSPDPSAPSAMLFGDGSP